MPVLSQGDVSHSDCGTTGSGGLGQLVLRWWEERIWSMPVQHPFKCPMTWIRQSLRLSISLQSNEGWRELGILTHATMIVFGGWDQCRQASTKDKERYVFFVRPLSLVVYFTTPDPRRYPEGCSNFERAREPPQSIVFWQPGTIK